MVQAPHPRRKPPLGLKNLGNSYLNSVLQCLAHTPPLARFCLAALHSSVCKLPNNCAFCIQERQIGRCLTLDTIADSLFKLQKSLTLFAEHFRVGRQEDAHEFLRYAVDACHNVSLKLHNVSPGKPGSTIMSEVFGVALLSQVKCMSCKGESNKTVEIMDVSLDIFQCTTVKGAFAKFFQPEVLDGNNKYGCGNVRSCRWRRSRFSCCRHRMCLLFSLSDLKALGKLFGTSSLRRL